MTQEEKIKEIIESCKLKNFAGIEGKYGDSLSLQRLEAMFLDWHTSELNRKMEEVVRVYADKIKADINNGVEYNKKNYNRDEITKEQIFAYLDHWLHDLKALLNVVNADDNQQHEQRRDN